MSTALTPQEPTMVTQTCSWNESTFTTMKPQVGIGCQCLCMCVSLCVCVGFEVGMKYMPCAISSLIDQTPWFCS